MEKIKLDAITNSIKNIIIAEVGASQQPVPAEFIQQSIDKVIESFGYSIEVDDLEHIRFRLETTFNVNLASDSIILSNPNVQRWFKKSKNEIQWNLLGGL